MNIHLDRSLPISLIDQIKGQLVYAISYGTVQGGERLPSVRELAVKLSIAPMTVSQVYKNLIEEGLLITRAGVGTFVADITHPNSLDPVQASNNNLFQIVDASVRQALLLGYSKAEIRRIYLKALDFEPAIETERHLLMVGNFNPATQAYARDTEARLQDLCVRVTPVLLDELKQNLENWREILDTVSMVITVPPRLHETRALLRSWPCQVAAVGFTTATDTKRKLSSIPASSRIGVAAVYPEFLHSLIDEVAAHCLSDKSPVAALLSQEDRINLMLAKVDVLVYSSGCESILGWLPENVLAIEYRYTPDPDTVNRLRFLID